MKITKILPVLAIAAVGFAIQPANASEITDAANTIETLQSPVKKAKEEGLIGEQHDGYLGIVNPDSATDEILALVKETNAQRKAKYKKQAKDGKVKVDIVQEKAGKRYIRLAEPGHYVKRAGEDWTQVVDEEEGR